MEYSLETSLFILEARTKKPFSACVRPRSNNGSAPDWNPKVGRNKRIGSGVVRQNRAIGTDKRLFCVDYGVLAHYAAAITGSETSWSANQFQTRRRLATVQANRSWQRVFARPK